MYVIQYNRTKITDSILNRRDVRRPDLQMTASPLFFLTSLERSLHQFDRRVFGRLLITDLIYAMAGGERRRRETICAGHYFASNRIWMHH
jgi:hypothetical protein